MTRSWWGWGDADRHLDGASLDGVARMVGARLGSEVPVPTPVRDPSALPPPSRIRPRGALAPIVCTEPVDRVRHSRGNGYRDVVRALHGELPAYVDAVLRPADEADVARVLEWATGADVACVPFGGGSSVVGGVTTPVGERPVVALDLERLAGVDEVDEVSLAAHVRGGTLGPAINDALRPHGLTLRFFPQSWEFSTLGGWVATRAGGHFATGPTHVDDLVESIEAVAPAGTWSSRRLPSSGAGPSPDRLLLGSEGSLAVVTGAWVRVQRRPTFRASATVTFPDVHAGLDALRAVTQADLRPANARLLDPSEAETTGAGDGTRAVLALGFEGADHPLGGALAAALTCCRDHGGRVDDGPHERTGDRTGEAGGGSGAWREAFLAAPYLRDALVRLGVVVETVETAVTWDRAHDAVDTLVAVAGRAASDVCGTASVTVRITHAYPDGCAPYLTVLAPGRRGDEVAQWDEVKTAVSEAITGLGGTITHHHGVGRDHAPWYREQVPLLHRRSLAAVRRELDPGGIMNPGVLGLGVPR